MSKESENGSEPRTEQDGMNEYVETAGEVKDNEVGKHKPENSSGQDEKNKSIEGKEEMEWLDHSEVQSQKRVIPDNFAYIGLIVFMGYQKFNCVYFLSVFILVYILVFLFSFSKRLEYLL